MREAHPEEFAQQWPPDNDSVNHARRKGQCGANSYGTAADHADTSPLSKPSANSVVSMTV
jgi:hypothetical protein